MAFFDDTRAAYKIWLDGEIMVACMDGLEDGYIFFCGDYPVPLDVLVM
jgi:hypothetical protein